MADLATEDTVLRADISPLHGTACERPGCGCTLECHAAIRREPMTCLGCPGRCQGFVVGGKVLLHDDGEKNVYWTQGTWS